MPIEIVAYREDADIEIAANLFREYQSDLNADLCFQGFEEELASLPGKYARPQGNILIAKYKEQIAGCVALRPIENEVAEMKRLYVKPAYRGCSIGKVLTREIIQEAKQSGYKSIRLDTLKRLHAAIELYKSFGFKPIEAYYNNPMDEVVFLELAL